MAAFGRLFEPIHVLLLACEEPLRCVVHEVPLNDGKLLREALEADSDYLVTCTQREARVLVDGVLRQAVVRNEVVAVVDAARQVALRDDRRLERVVLAGAHHLVDLEAFGGDHAV